MNPAIISQSSIGATCAFAQLSTASNLQLPVFSGTVPPAGKNFALARLIKNTGLFEYVPDHRTHITVFSATVYQHQAIPPISEHCPNNWSNFADGSCESSNSTTRVPVYPSSQSCGNQNSNPYRQWNIHPSVKLPDIWIQKFDGDPLNKCSSMFSSTIHNNADITETERMSYMQSFVNGLAKDCLSGFFAIEFFTLRPFKSSKVALETRKTFVDALKKTRRFPKTSYEWPRSFYSFCFALKKVVPTFASHCWHKFHILAQDCPR